MNIKKVHKQFLTSKLLFFTIVFVFIAIRLYYIYDQADNLVLWGCLLMQAVIAFFLLQLDHIFNIIQVRTFLPATFYLLFIGSNPVFYNDLRGSIAALCLVSCYYFLFRTYQNPKSQVYAMNISILLVTGSLFWMPLLFFFPLFWIGFYRFQCFNGRVFFANLIGFVIVYMFIFTWSLFQGDKNIFLSLLPQFDELLTVYTMNFSVLEWITLGFVLFIYIVIGIFLFFFNISERVWTVSVLTYLYFSVLFILAVHFLHSESKSSWELVFYLPIAFLTGHFFSRTNNRGIYFLLLLFFLFFIGIGIVQNAGS